MLYPCTKALWKEEKEKEPAPAPEMETASDR